MKWLYVIPVMCLLCVACSHDRNCGGPVRSEENSADWAITTKVKAAILSDTSISGSARFVSVSTTNGVVTLTGSVSSREDRDKIVRIANNVRGVKDVDNQMTIK
jgi:hyperosmotically inducible protein